MAKIGHLEKASMSIDCYLTGGLGNQLYTWAGATHIATITGKALKLHLDTGANFGINHGSDIRALALPVGELCRFSKGPMSKFHLHRFRKAKYFKQNSTHSEERVLVNSGLTRISMKLGDNLECIFGTHFNPDSITYLRESGLIAKIALRNPSLWYQEFVAKNKSSENIGLHLRLGNYLEFMKDALLARDYYLKAIALARKSGGGEVFIFSDEPNKAQKLLGDQRGVKFVIPPYATNDEESMFLMSNFGRLIISNSTFSTWAGILAGESTVVFCPPGWDKSRPELKELFLPEWTRVY